MSPLTNEGRGYTAKGGMPSIREGGWLAVSMLRNEKQKAHNETEEKNR